MTTPADASGAVPEALRDPARLSALDATGLIDGPYVAGLDRLTALTAQVLGVPTATVTLVSDTEQFFASSYGLGEPWNTRRRTPLSHSFCQHVVTSETPLILDDARDDERVCENLAIPELGVIAYAGIPLRDPDGRVLGSFCAIDSQPRHWTEQDVATLEKLADAAASEIALLLANQELRRSTAHLDDVLAFAHDAFVSIGAAGAVLEWNTAAERLFGYSKAEALAATTLADLVVPERFRFAHQQGLARVRDGGLVSRRQEVTARNRAGIEFPVQMTLHVAPHRGGPIIHAFIYSVTEQHDRELSLQRERTFLAGVVDSVDVGVAACGSDGSMALFNKAMRRVWGTAPEPVTVQSWGEAVGLYEPDGVTRLPAAQAPLARALNGEQVRDLEMLLDAPGIGRRRFLANAQPVVTAEGRSVGAVVALHDITDLRRSEMIRAAQDVAARTFGEGTSTQDGVRQVIGDVCQVMGWTGGEYWQVDAERDVLTRLTAWWTPDLDPQVSQVEAEAQLDLGRGEGLSGRVWSSGKPLWVNDLAQQPEQYSRLAPFAAAGLRGAIGLYNQSDGQPGVLTFLAARMDEPDRELLIALEAITAHIGRFLERRRTRDLMISLTRARQDFNRVIETVNDHVWTVRLLPEGRLRTMFASANQQAVFGGRLGPDSRVGQLVHPDDLPAFEEYMRICLSGEPAEITCRMLGLDGVTRWVWNRSAMRREGDAVYLDGISTNVTARKEQEIELHEERRRLRQAQAIARIGSWEWNTDHTDLTWTDTLYELYGVDPATISPRLAHNQSIHPEDEPRMREAMTRLQLTGEPFRQRYRIVRPDGQLRVLEVRGEALPDHEQRLTRHAGTAMDVTEQIETQRAVVSREAMLRAVLANSQSLIYVKDLQGRYLMANETLLRARGLPEEELLGQDDFSLDPVLAPVWRENDRRAIVEGEYVVEEWFEAAEGRHYYNTAKFPLYDGEGQIYAVCGISLDITAHKRAAEAMLEARDAALAATEAKSQFLATMSHEIRTPMNAVIGMTDLLLETELDARQLEYVETVRTSGDALLALINNILDFSRIEAGEMELESRAFDLRRCVEDSLSLIAGQGAAVDLVSHVDVDCPTFVCGDANRLRQVLVNLVGNAVKFTERGEVLVSVTCLSAPGLDRDPLDDDSLPASPHDPPQAEIKQSFVPDGPDEAVRLRIKVRDTGIGIPADRMDRLFKSFSQVDASTTRVYGGSGLGLAISRAIVEAMGGRIDVTSAVGQGSTFSFDITLEACDPALAEQLAGPTPDLTGRMALVVDDNDTNRRILRLQLEGWGMSVIDMPTPAGALALVHSGATFDLAILDLEMPEMNGVQLAASIRETELGRGLPMVLLTSLDFTPTGATSELFVGYHTKPIRSDMLRSMLAEVLTVPTGVPVGPPRQPLGARRPEPAGRALRVLLAEDNLVNQKVALGMLANLGHQVDIASDGAEALSFVQGRDYDIVLMDIHMPTLDGLDATRAIRAQLPAGRQPQIVAMTASTLDEDRRAAVEAGMNGYLLKPVRIADLAEVLRGVPPFGTVVAEVPVAGAEPSETGFGGAGSASESVRESGSVAEPERERAVDVGVLRRLTVDMGADSPHATAELIEAYLEQGGAWMADLGAAARCGDLAQVRTIVHTLGSSSLLLGAAPLAFLLAETGRIARHEGAPEHDQVELVAMVDAVIGEYRRVDAALRVVLAEDRPSTTAAATEGIGR